MFFTLEDPFQVKGEINQDYIEKVRLKLKKTRAFLNVDSYAEFSLDMKLYDYIVNNADPVARAKEYRVALTNAKKRGEVSKKSAAIELGWQI